MTAQEQAKDQANRIKHQLRKEGYTLKKWAETNEFNYRTVSDVVRGLNKGSFGEGRDIAIKLGLVAGEAA